MGKQRPETTSGVAAGEDDALRCAVCEHRVTFANYRVERSGSHEHTFVNPGGYVHRIGCFVAAPGCIHVGDSHSAFTWFPGFSWQLAMCGRCRAHLGWVFRCLPDQFHGLILSALKA